MRGELWIMNYEFWIGHKLQACTSGGYVFDPNSRIDPLGLSGRGGAKHKEIQEQLRDDLKGLGKNVGTEGQIKLKNDKSRFGDVVIYADNKKKQYGY